MVDAALCCGCQLFGKGTIIAWGGYGANFPNYYTDTLSEEECLILKGAGFTPAICEIGYIEQLPNLPGGIEFPGSDPDALEIVPAD